MRLVGVDSVGQGQAGDRRGAWLAAGFDQGVLELLGLDARFVSGSVVLCRVALEPLSALRKGYF